MGNYKKFGELSKNDCIFSVSIKDSMLRQDCLGSIYDKFILTELNTNENNEMVLSFIYDRSPFIKGWTPEKEPVNETSVIKVRADSDYKILDIRGEEGKLNKIIYSTNIETIVEKVGEIFEEYQAQVNELRDRYNKINNLMINMKNNFAIRRGMCKDYLDVNEKPAYKELVVTEEIIV